MPLGSTIGRGMGINNPYNLRLIVEAAHVECSTQPAEHVCPRLWLRRHAGFVEDFPAELLRLTVVALKLHDHTQVVQRPGNASLVPEFSLQGEALLQASTRRGMVPLQERQTSCLIEGFCLHGCLRCG